MIGLLVTIRDAVLAVLMGWVSAGTGENVDRLNVGNPDLSLVPVASRRCMTDGDQIPKPEGA